MTEKGLGYMDWLCREGIKGIKRNAAMYNRGERGMGKKWIYPSENNRDRALQKKSCSWKIRIARGMTGNNKGPVNLSSAPSQQNSGPCPSLLAKGRL